MRLRARADGWVGARPTVARRRGHGASRSAGPADRTHARGGVVPTLEPALEVSRPGEDRRELDARTGEHSGAHKRRPDASDVLSDARRRPVPSRCSARHAGTAGRSARRTRCQARHRRRAGAGSRPPVAPAAGTAPKTAWARTAAIDGGGGWCMLGVRERARAPSSDAVRARRFDERANMRSWSAGINRNRARDVRARHRKG